MQIIDAKDQKKFEELDNDYKNKMQNYSVEEIDRELAELAKLEAAKRAEMKEDPDLKQAKEKVKSIAAPFREDLKFLKLKTKYGVYMLEIKGKI